MSFLGRFLVEQGAISEEQLDDALRFQRENNRRIGEVAVDRGVLSPEQVGCIRDRQQEDPRLFGDIAVGERRLTRRTLDELLFFQKIQHTYLGEALLLRGHISRERYQQLLGRHWALRDTGRISLRYLQDFFADNRIAELLVAAVSRVVRRLGGEEMVVSAIGSPLDLHDYPEAAVIEGDILGGRRLAAGLGLSAALVAELAGATAGGGEGRPVEVFFVTALRYFGDMLRDASLLLTEGRLTSGADFQPSWEESLNVRGQTPSGEVGFAIWLEDVPS